MQTQFALSSAESEFLALSAAKRRVKALIYLLEEINEKIVKVTSVPTVYCRVFEDNSAALEIAKAIDAYLNRVREQGDTGEEAGIGADDYKFDNTSGEGEEMVITGESKLKLESAEQWMRAVDTQPRDFLRTKFALEAATESEP